MGRHTAPVDDHLVLSLSVGLPPGEVALRLQAGLVVPDPVPVRLLIDTGAKRTTLIPQIIGLLDPPSGPVVQVSTALASGMTTLFWVRLDLSACGLRSFDLVSVARLAMPPGLASFHGLLGRDLLRQWDALLYEGRRSRLTLRDAPGPFGGLRRWL